METESERKAFDAIAAEAMGRPARPRRGSRSWPTVLRAQCQSPRSRRNDERRGPDAAEGSPVHRMWPMLRRSCRAFPPLRSVFARPRLGPRREIERLHREGREAADQARREAEREGKVALDRSVQQIGAALEGFRREREDYFARVEREVVQLALAIAARVLNREAQFDPMLLSGAVRVALGHLGETTEFGCAVRLIR